MKIRSITCFINPEYPINEIKLLVAKKLLEIAKPAYSKAGYEVQTTRLASVPFPSLLARRKDGALAELALKFEGAAINLGYDYVSLGPAAPEQKLSYDLIPEALSVAQHTFFAGLMTDGQGRVSLDAVRQCASIIQRSSTISPDGFANLRFAALANVLPGSPFFPAAYHQGDEPSFALATEAADLAVTAFSQANILEEARLNLVHSIETHANSLTKVALEIEQISQVKFSGIDFSLAPFPEQGRSIGTSLERLGVPGVGSHGTLAAAAILADTIDQANFTRTGFCGLFLPVLEDSVLAQRVAEGGLNAVDLLLYSAVCGTGLDTLPLPGDTTLEQLYAILLDLACLSTRLGKQLTARLMPIPGKKAGDATGFTFDYFANSRVMKVNANALNKFLGAEGTITLRPRPLR